MSEKTRDALRLADFWLRTICDEFDVDPETTTVTVNAVSDAGKRELAKRNLQDSMEQITAALKESTP